MNYKNMNNEQIIANLDEMLYGLGALPEWIAQMTNEVEQSNIAMTESSQAMANINIACNEVNNNVNDLVEVTGQNSEEISAVAETNTDVSRAFEKIQEMSKIIEDVSQRIGVFSINTSIEAAHLGAAGNGLQVLAEEFRRLADETRRNVTEIKVEIKKAKEKIANNETRIKRLSENFAKTTEKSQINRDMLIEMSAAITEQAGSTEQIKTSCANLLEKVRLIDELSGDVGSRKDLVKELGERATKKAEPAMV